MEDAPIRESYSFLCRGCGRVWQEGYEIRRVHDSAGLIQSAFCLDGHRTPSPLTQGRCAGCGSARVLVTHLTRGRRPRGGAMMEVSGVKREEWEIEMTGIEVLTAGRYGYADRRIHRDDFAHQLAVMLPADDDERLRPATAVSAEDLVRAAKLCRHLAERYPAEPLGRLAQQIAYRLEHPITHPGAMVYYAAALLCREQEALSRVESATMVAAVLEARAAAAAADTLEATAPQTLRYTVKCAIDGDFVRGARHVKAHQN